MSRRPARRAARGFTLIELMVALALGLLVTQAVISIFLSSTRSFRTSEGISQMQEEGRLATLLVAPVVRQAGYVPDPVRTQVDPVQVFTSASGKSALRGTDNAAPTIYTGLTAASMATGTDSLAISFLGHDATGDASLRSCLGDPVAAGQMAVNVYYVTPADARGVSSLACWSNIAAPTDALGAGAVRNEALLAGISDLQIVYGIDTTGDRVADRYVKADAVTDWTQVASVKLSYIADSTSKAVAGAADGDQVKNGRIRRRFSTTLQVRNRLSS